MKVILFYIKISYFLVGCMTGDSSPSCQMLLRNYHGSYKKSKKNLKKWWMRNSFFQFNSSPIVCLENKFFSKIFSFSGYLGKTKIIVFWINFHQKGQYWRYVTNLVLRSSINFIIIWKYHYGNTVW